VEKSTSPASSHRLSFPFLYVQLESMQCPSPRTQLQPSSIVFRPCVSYKTLRRDDGTSFLVVYRAGPAIYHPEVDDPFFAAHYGPDGFINPDYEATALGCFEQFQYCVPRHGICAPWGPQSQHVPTLVRDLHIDQDVGSLAEMTVFFRGLPFMISTITYLYWRIQPDRTPPLTMSTEWTSTARFNRREQWVTEVETWFKKGILETLLYFQRATQNQLKEFEPSASMDFRRKFSLCGRILFRDGDYTNINWLGLWVTTASLSVICFVSCMLEWIHNTMGTLFKDLASLPGSTLAMLLSIAEMVRRFILNGEWRSLIRSCERQMRLVTGITVPCSVVFN
jgi:hypothetical protein